ncbi:Kinesin-like protein KIF11-A [Galdieria sulphuraria]|nr:Kinesin-like protein KIF11-A [Galdieria sulphuraria]
MEESVRSKGGTLSTASSKGSMENGTTMASSNQTQSPGGFASPVQYIKGKRAGEEEKAVNVQVALRCRPLNKKEQLAGEECVISCNETKKEVKVVANGEKAANTVKKSQTKSFLFDKVFGMEATQEEVYECVCKPIVEEVLNGYNCTVFAYGQTGTGKTHTMEGQRDEKDGLTFDITNTKDLKRKCPPSAGVIPRAIRHIFHYLQDIQAEYTVRVSYLELYNEQLTDLLGIDGNEVDLRIYEDPQKGTFVAGLEEVPVRSEEEIFSILEKSAVKRRTAETLMNKYSSRSHSIFSITIHIKESTPEGEDLLKVGKLNLVDLAGSENIGRSGAQNMRAREAGNINQSLLTLGRVITSLVEHHPHIPYRDSKLTRLLQESLGGRNKTCIIATVCPGVSSLDETLSTLDYACRAKNIKNRPTVNQMMAKRTLIKEYTDEIARLKAELEATRSKNGIYLPTDMYEKLMAKQALQSDTIDNLEAKMAKTEEEMEQLRKLFEDNKKELEETKHTLQRTQDRLKHTKRKLAETKRQLKKVTKDRDEKEYLLKCHKETEVKLHGQATDLKGTLEKSLEDVENLFAKIQRKQSIEDHNIEAASQFAQQSQTTVSSLQQNIQRYLQERVQRYGWIEKQTDEFLQLQREQSSKVKLQVENLLSQANKGLQELVKESDEYTKQYTERQNHYGVDYQKNIKHMQSVFEQLVETYTEDHRSIQQNINENIESIHLFARQSLDHLQQQENSMQVFLNSQVQHFHDIVNCLFAENEKQKERLRATEQVIESNARKQSEFLDEAKDEAFKAIQATLDKLVTRSKSAQAEATQENKNTLLDCSNGLAIMQQQLERNVSQAEQNLEEYRQDAIRSKTKMAEETNQSLKQQIDRESAALQKTELSTKHLEQGMKEADRTRTEGLELHKNFLEDSQNITRDYVKRRDTTSEITTQELLNSKNLTEEHIEQGIQNDTRTAAKVKDGLSEEQSALQDFNKKQVGFVDSIASSVDELMTSGLRVDEPTSNTPRKRQWNYPQVLERTQSYEELLRIFYANYKEPSEISDESDDNGVDDQQEVLKDSHVVNGVSDIELPTSNDEVSLSSSRVTIPA